MNEVMTKHAVEPKHFLSLTTLSLDEITHLLSRAEEFAQGEEWKVNKQTFAANLFFEPSTRTRFSFEVAERN